ncbi:MAG: class I SAM-dependent methyltransferase [Actinomycetota bacterium]|nr:class I SAM-dependent methyltransferase [Actinomycetota bacterium]
MSAEAEQRRYVEVVARLGVANLPPGGRDMLEEMVRLVPRDARLVLDLGCNTGSVAARVAAEVPAATVVGIDRSPAMIESARRRYPGTNPSFQVLDVECVGEAFRDADAALCGGSSAFFAERVTSLRAISTALAPTGVLIDAHYVYDPAVPRDLRKREERSFGVRSPVYSAGECLAPYEVAELPVQSYIRRDPWQLPDKPEAAPYRSILASLPGMAPVVREMVSRRELIAQLARHRHPVLVTASLNEAASGSRSHGVAEALAVMEFFQEPFPREPMSSLRSMLPYEFLAYVGDPDAAPGGGAAVKRIASLLSELGVGEAAPVLDVGCFTGLSTIILARSFPRVLGVDIDPTFVRVARALGERMGSTARFRCMDGAGTQLAASSQDAYVMTATLGYTPQPEALLAEAMRVVRPGGFLVEFLYHYPIATGAVERRVRRAVGPDVRVTSLSSQVEMVERAGFRLVRAERICRQPARPEFVAAVCAGVIAAERKRNPHLREGDFDEFAELFRQYVGRVDLGNAEPSVYLCVFARPSQSNGDPDE